MNEIDLDEGVEKAFDALDASRLSLLCGAGLSMAQPSNLPSAAELARAAKQRYDATHCPDRSPLPESIDDQAEFFFRNKELATIYLPTYIDSHAFASKPNKGHYAAADLLLTAALTTAITTNVDQLIENAGALLFGQIGAGVSMDEVSKLKPDVAPLLKIHGCWSDPAGTIWAKGQVAEDPTKSRIAGCSQWLSVHLLNRDILIVGYWTDWDYLNHVLETTLGAVNPSRVIVVDPCETDSFQEKAAALFALGQRATIEFVHVKCSGDVFLDRLRVRFSRSMIRRTISSGADTYQAEKGAAPNADWFNPESSDSRILWQIRRDLEGCYPGQPARSSKPVIEPLLGLVMLQLQARGAAADGRYWNLDGHNIRVLRAANQPLHEVEKVFSGEIAPAIAPDFVIAVGAEPFSLPPDIARGGGSGSIVGGNRSKWLCRSEAEEALNL